MTPSTSPRIFVIGAGIGGLSAAIRLAAAGQSVTLIETQHSPGGKMRTLPGAPNADGTPGPPVDAGPTVLTLRAVFDDLFASAGARLDDHLTLIPQPRLARHFWPDGARLDLFSDPDQSAQAIAEFSGPKSADQFRRFNRLAQSAYTAFAGPMIRAPRPNPASIALAALRHPTAWPALIPGRSLQALLTASFTDPRLRQLFGRYATYVGGLPHKSPAVLSLIWAAEAQGVWAVQGGMARLAQELAALASRLGVQILYGQSVQQITRQDGHLAEVVLSNGRALKADRVVFNGDPAALLAGLLGPGPQQALPPTAAHPRSLSAVVWAFAACRAAGAPDLAHHNVFFTADPDTEFLPLERGDLPSAASLYLCAQDRDMGLPPPDSAANDPNPSAERFQIILNAPPRNTLSAKDIAQCRALIFPTLARHGLTFPPPPDTALTTPPGFATLFPGSQGAIYGRSPHGTLASFQRPTARTQLPGLYLAGGGAHPGAGVPMAALSGLHAAEAILTDQISASPWPQTAMRGGMSMVCRLTGRAPSR